MEEKSTKILSFEVPAEQAQAAAEAAKELGISLSEYLRKRLLNLISGKEETGPIPLSRDPIMLLQHILYCVQRIHSNQHQIAHMTGALSAEDLDVLGNHTIEQGINFLANLEQRMAKTRQDLAAFQSAK